jgi:hypothetical protein
VNLSEKLACPMVLLTRTIFWTIGGMKPQWTNSGLVWVIEKLRLFLSEKGA